MTEFGSFNHSPGKRVLNNLKTICLRFWKVVVQRVAVIKFRVNNRCDNGTGSFEVFEVFEILSLFIITFVNIVVSAPILIGADTTKFTNVIIRRLKER